MAWYKHFDVQKHAVHKDDPKSKILILTQHKDNDEKRMKQLKRKKRAQFEFEVIDVTKLNIQTLLNKIFYDEEFGGYTNLILNFYNSNSECQQKLEKLAYEELCPMRSMPGYGHRLIMDADNFKFIELAEAWLSTLNGAYLMSGTETSGASWKEKVERLCTSNIISKKKVYSILVLSGTHGLKNLDGIIPVSGFTRENLLDERQFEVDSNFAKDLMKEMKNIGFKLEIEVANMKDFCKQLEPNKDKDLCEFVQGKEPNMVILAWCYSTNGNILSLYFSKASQTRNTNTKICPKIASHSNRHCTVNSDFSIKLSSKGNFNIN